MSQYANPSGRPGHGVDINPGVSRSPRTIPELNVSGTVEQGLNPCQTKSLVDIRVLVEKGVVFKPDNVIINVVSLRPVRIQVVAHMSQVRDLAGVEGRIHEILRRPENDVMIPGPRLVSLDERSTLIGGSETERIKEVALLPSRHLDGGRQVIGRPVHRDPGSRHQVNLLSRFRNRAVRTHKNLEQSYSQQNADTHGHQQFYQGKTGFLS